VESFNHGWVAITGATDGIGRGFADEFAARGFKVILISRNLDKLRSVSADIQRVTDNRNIEVV
jgi:17beta-estradiol 17-dehydrogenase / very-long-chain 3-oxoacyl-CoA reductase